MAWGSSKQNIYGSFGRLSRFCYSRPGLMVILLMAVLAVDTSVFRISDLFRINMTTDWTTPLFAILCLLFLVLQYFALGAVRSKNRRTVLTRGFGVESLSKVIFPIQVILSAIIIFIVLETIFLNYFDMRIVSLDAIISFGAAIFFLLVLAQKFFYWFRLNRSKVVLMYAISSSLLAIKSTFSLMLIIVMSSGIPLYVGSSQIGGMTLNISANPLASTLNETLTIFTVLSFIIFWISTAMLLTSYAKKLGKVTYWILLSIPLIYFLSQFPALVFKIFEDLLISNPSLYGIILTVLFGLSSTAGGILFGIAFWIISRHLEPDNPVRNYALIAACGISLFFAADQGGSVLYRIGGLYPPFGLITISAMGLSSYFMLVGIYLSAISVAQDSRLRKIIRSSVQEQLHLLDKIGTAEMQKDIENKVVYFSRRNTSDLIENTGVEPSLSDSDLKQYMK
ncbi:MAG: hypothetical protein WAL24_02335, partial [Nitrososphaeraceae archaeon]